MLFKIIFTLAAFSGVAQAGQLRAAAGSTDAGGNTEESSPDTTHHRGLTQYDNHAFYLESKAWGDDNYLGYHPSTKYAHIDPNNKNKFAYHDYHLEEYNSAGGKTGWCYGMDDAWKVKLETCNYGKAQQKWLLSEAPEEYGHYYSVTNAYYGYVLEYSATDQYKLATADWKNVKYDDKDYMNKILFYKEAAYYKNTGKACRTSGGTQGQPDGGDYSLYKNTGRDDCSKKCSDDHKCAGWEYSNTSAGSRRCEIWYTKPVKFAGQNGFDCYVKQY